MIYTFPLCTVTNVYEKKSRHHKQGAGPDAIFNEVSLGWHVELNGVFSLFIGLTKPDLEVGDKVKLSMEKK